MAYCLEHSPCWRTGSVQLFRYSWSWSWQYRRLLAHMWCALRHLIKQITSNGIHLAGPYVNALVDIYHQPYFWRARSASSEGMNCSVLKSAAYTMHLDGRSSELSRNGTGFNHELNETPLVIRYHSSKQREPLTEKAFRSSKSYMQYGIEAVILKFGNFGNGLLWRIPSNALLWPIRIMSVRCPLAFRWPNLCQPSTGQLRNT